MIQRFADTPSKASRALQCYLILIGCAHRRETTTYKGIAKLLGYEKPEGGPGSTGAGVVGKMVGDLMWWCRQNELPPLTSLIINEETGLPGVGVRVDLAEVPLAQQKVYEFDWYAIACAICRKSRRILMPFIQICLWFASSGRKGTTTRRSPAASQRW
jgi:hypothetical protein